MLPRLLLSHQRKLIWEVSSISLLLKVAPTVKNSTFRLVINRDELDKVSMKPNTYHLQLHGIKVNKIYLLPKEISDS